MHWTLLSFPPGAGQGHDMAAYKDCNIMVSTRFLSQLHHSEQNLRLLCSSSELGSVIIVACCPSIPRLFRKQIRRASPCSGYSNGCCHSASNSGSKPASEALDDSRGKAVQRSNSVITLQMYGYANSINPRESEDITSFGGEEDLANTPRSILPNDTRV